jgi:heat shock protein HslJ
LKFPKLLLLIFLSILSACTSAAAQVTTPAVEPTTPVETENPLANTRWTLISFGAPGAEIPVLEGSALTLEFEADGQAGGSGGCNSYGGEYRVQDNTLSLSQLNSTLMACADERVTQQEQAYLEALHSAGQFELTENHLTLSYNGGQGALNFSPAAATTPPSTQATPPSQSTIEPAAAAYENLISPVDLLASYYNGINRQEYQRAYGYWENPPNSYDEFVAGFADTASVQLIVQPPTRLEGAAGSLYAEIPAVLIALHKDGSLHTFAACFATRKSNLQPPDIPEEDVWHLYQAQVEAVPNEAAIPTLLTQACQS